MLLYNREPLKTIPEFFEDALLPLLRIWCITHTDKNVGIEGVF